MGVHELWPVLEPVKHHVPLQSLIGKTLAVDLSIWVCEAQSVKQMVGVVAKPHLRNLFFRVSSLSLMGVKLVFVMEGEAPKIKADTMNKRNEMRFGPSNKPAPSRPGRSYFKSVLKECLCMLDCLGVPWVQAAGEAEAMCAYLDASGYVDGCITNDGDVFLYGAKSVYRNFTMNMKDPHVDCYESSAIKDKLGLDRESLVGLAILLGCDYIPKGLPGVGREMALKFIKSLNGESILQRFYQWRKQFDDHTVNPKIAKKVVHCSVCCHPGSSKEHTRKGCGLCGSDHYCEPHDHDYLCTCGWHNAEQEKKNKPLDYTLKMKAKKREGFPYLEVIKEFLENKDQLSKVIKWRRPSLPCFQSFAQERMGWPNHYSCEKGLVLLTYYDMQERKAGRQHDAQLQAARILKTRVRNGVSCFEIEWVKPESYVFPDDHALDAPLLTIEEESLFTDAYPHIVDLFKKDKMEAELLKHKSKKSKPKSKAPPSVDDVASLLSEICLAPSEEKSPLSPVPACCGDGERLPTISLQGPYDPHSLLVSALQSTPPGTLYSVKKDSNMSLSFLFGEDDPENPQNQCFSPVPNDGNEPLLSTPNISSVISDLQLSSIDWEATSFSQSPQVDSPTTCNKALILEDKSCVPEPSNSLSSLSNVIQENAKPSMHSLKDRTDWPPALVVDSPCVSHLEKLPLRERILLRNASQFENLNPQILPQEPQCLVSVKEKMKENASSNNCTNFKENVEMYPKLLRLPYQKKPNQNAVISKLSGIRANSHVPQCPITKPYSFVKKTSLCPMRTLPDSSVTAKPKAEVKKMPVKSVCHKIALSSEVEPVKEWKNEHAIKSILPNLTKDDPLIKMVAGKLKNSSLPDVAGDFGIDLFSSPKSQTAVRGITQGEQSDCDDSIVSVDSPLPLSERLKLRLQQN